MTIESWLRQATTELQGHAIPSAYLDAEIILAHTVRYPRTWLHAHIDENLEDRQIEIANARLDLRKSFVPVAYIIGHKDFYGRRFKVSPATLIPRPESEAIIELLSRYLPTTRPLDTSIASKRLVDIGTGSGCLGITAKLEHPELEVTLLDISSDALRVAKKNAALLSANVSIQKSNLLIDYAYTPDIILANLPYVDESWERSKETRHEPAIALFASDAGLRLVKKCFDQLSSRTNTGAIAIFEADPRQWDAIEKIAQEAGFTLDTKQRFVASFIKA
jgi:release factor glutamine methyltransferase